MTPRLRHVAQAVALVTALSLAALAAFAVGRSTATDEASAGAPHVRWWDDFLGVAVDSAYAIALAGSGAVAISSDPMENGWVCLSTGQTPDSAARLRLGEDTDDGLSRALNFSARAGVTLRARAVVLSDGAFDATIGLVSMNDPDNVGGALLYSPSSGWILQTANGGLDAGGTGAGLPPERVSTVATNWAPAPSQTFVVEIRSSVAGVSVTADGREIASLDTNIPEYPMLVEFQLWNHDYGTSPRLCLDYVEVEQPRLPDDVRP